MNTDMLNKAIGEIKDDHILDAADFSSFDDDPLRNGGTNINKHAFRNRILIRILTAAACLGLVAFAAFKIPRTNTLPPGFPTSQLWSEYMSAGDYFKYSKGRPQETSESDSLIMGPAALQINLSDKRSAFETDGIIPGVSDHPEHHFSAEYNGDGSLYRITFWWMGRDVTPGTLDGYSDLKFIAAPKEIHELSDVISIRTDSAGNELPPYVTETVRDGISIYGEGAEDENKTLTWKTDKGWFQIYGCWKDSYESMIELLDWFWANPFDMTGFAAAPEGTIIYSTRVEYPDAFAEQIPDFAALGYKAESEKVNLGLQDDSHITAIYDQNDSSSYLPIRYDGVYTRENVRIRWTINIGADQDSWNDSLGRPSEITPEKLEKALENKNYVNIFFNLPCMATLTVEAGSAADAWEIIQSLR